MRRKAAAECIDRHTPRILSDTVPILQRKVASFLSSGELAWQRKVTFGFRCDLHERHMTFENMSDEEILHVANPIMFNLMDASTAIDHERHIRDFSERMKAIVTKEYLQKICEKYQREKG